MNRPSTKSESCARQSQSLLVMATEVYNTIIDGLCFRPAEAGFLLLGPIGSNVITCCYFDAGAACSSATYSPDHVTLNRMLKEIWIPSGIDFKGFAHSHPGHADRLSDGDISYISRLLRANEDMPVFAAPIVVPALFCMRPYVVCRSRPHQPVLAELVLFPS